MFGGACFTRAGVIFLTGSISFPSPSPEHALPSNSYHKQRSSGDHWQRNVSPVWLQSRRRP